MYLCRVVLLWLSLCLSLLPCTASAQAATILVFGDSLSAGYGLARHEGWVHLLALRLQEKRLDYTVVNASISGETTLGGAHRIEAALRTHRPAVVILALGANDGLRGADIAGIRANLERVISAAQRVQARVVLVGMRIPPNYGADYTEKFQGIYAAAAKTKRVTLVPFLLEGFARHSKYFQADQLHPAAIAQPLMLDTVWKALAPDLKKIK